ncbi:MAG: TolC family protein [Bacteroidota bacterium]
MHKSVILLLLLGVGWFVSGQGQSSMILSLSDCVALAKGESPAANISQLDLEANQADYRAFLAGLKPQIFLNGDLPGFRRSITGVLQDNGQTLFKTQSQAFSTASLSFSQIIPWTGGRVSVFSSLANFTFIDTMGFTTWQTAPIGIRLNQPLFAVNRFKWDKRERDQEMSLTEVSYLQELEDAAVEVTQLFFDAIVAQANARQAQTNVVNNDTIFQLSEGRFSVGRIAENELLQSELSLMNARASLASAQLAYQQAIQRLNTFLGLPPSTELELLAPKEGEEILIDPNQAVAQAQQYGQLTQFHRLQQVRAERAMREAQRENRLQADLVASFGLNQTGTTVEEAFHSPESTETFSIGLSLPIVQWGAAKAQLQAARYRQESLNQTIQQQQTSFANDVYYSALQIVQLREQVNISARSDTVAQKRYEITKNRYLIGKVSIQDLFIAQQEKDAARVAYYANLRQYWLALAQLRSSTLYDFEKGVPLGQ